MLLRILALALPAKTRVHVTRNFGENSEFLREITDLQNMQSVSIIPWAFLSHINLLGDKYIGGFM
jgi:hypothetical protein